MPAEKPWLASVQVVLGKLELENRKPSSPNGGMTGGFFFFLRLHLSYFSNLFTFINKA